MAESHDSVTPLDRLTDPRLGPVRRPDGVEHVQGAAGRTPVQGPGQCADGPDDGGGEVGPGGCDDPGREGGGVEPVVDGEHQVLLDGPNLISRGLAPEEHPQVVGRVAEVVTGWDGLLPLLEAERGGEQGGNDCAEPHRLGPKLLVVDVVGGAPAELGTEDRDRGAQDVERRPRGRQVGEHPGQSSGDLPLGRHLLSELAGGHPIGQRPVEEELPDVLERSGRGQLGGGVLAVVEEPFLPADVAHRRLGHHHAFEPAGHVGAEFVGRPDLGHGQEITDGDHADQLAAVHHGEVPVVVVGES